MDAILNNPFRILGLPVTASDKEISKRISDLLIYTEMGKKVSFDTDLPFLGELTRTADTIKLAAKKIELPENKIFYSLLCFDLEDSFEKESIEYLKEGNFEKAIKVLENEIFNNCPVVYSQEKTINYILKNIQESLKNDSFINNKFFGYVISKGPSKSMSQSIRSNIYNNYYIKTYNRNSGSIVEIGETIAEIDLKDKYEIASKFNWTEINEKDVFIGLGLKNGSDIRYYILVSPNGNVSFYKENQIIFQKNLDNSDFFEKESNYLVIKKYNNNFEIVLNKNILLKVELIESFNSTFLCLSGKQKILLEDLSLSTINHKKILTFDDEINENTFSYSKNISIIYLTEIIKRKKVAGILLYYFGVVGNFLKKPYFLTYTRKIISDNYNLNFEILFDIFIREFYLSFNHLIDNDKEYSTQMFYNSFASLSDTSEKRVLEILKGSKPYNFEIFIKTIAKKRIDMPHNSCDYAYELINEAIDFFKWFSKFRYSNIEVNSIRDKVATEILECAISYYNSIFPKSIDKAKQTLKLMTKSSDYAYNEMLRDRINKNISTIIDIYKITEYNIIDFSLKDNKKLIIPTIKSNKSFDSINSQTNKEIPPQSEGLPNKIRKTNKLNYQFFSIIFTLCIVIIGIIFWSTRDKRKYSISNKNEIQNNKPFLSPIEASKWKGNILQNGSSPYDGFFGKGVYDYNSECWINFKNGNLTDAIVCLENVSNGRTIRNEYIQAGTDYQMTNIPEGVYKVKVFYGNDWNPEKTMNNGAIRGAFDTDQSYSLSDKLDDLIRMKITETYNGISYTTGEITLYTVSNGNMNQRNINSDEFFK